MRRKGSDVMSIMEAEGELVGEPERDRLVGVVGVKNGEALGVLFLSIARRSRRCSGDSTNWSWRPLSSKRAAGMGVITDEEPAA